MSDLIDPPRLFDGGLVDGEPPSADMLELLGILRGATASAGRLTTIHAGATSRGSWGRWLVVVCALGLGVASTAMSTGAVEPAAATARAVAVIVASSPAVLPRAAISAPEPAAITAPAAEATPSPEPSAVAHEISLPTETTPDVPRRLRRPRVARAGAEHVPAGDGAPSPAAALAPLAIVASADVASAIALTDDTAPSELYASALAEYARGCCDCAVTPLQHVIEGSTGDSPLAVRRAELLLGVCLARMGWTQSALSVLDGIAGAGAAHPYFAPALSELARLAPRLPDPSVLVASFRHDDEARLVDEDPLPADAAAYFQGRARYEDGDLASSARLFARVSSASPFHRAARFYEGLVEVRLRHATRAATAFRAVIDASPDGDRYRDLATLALARLYYSAAQSGDVPSDGERQAELLAQALEAWRRVPLSSEHFLDAFFEESWALYLAGEDSRALGHVFGLLSPFFETTEHPEAWVVRGTIHFEHCLYDEADEDVREFHARYDDVLAALETLAEIGDDDALALYTTRAAALSGPTRSLVASSIFDRDAERRSEHLRDIEAESVRLRSAPFADGTLGARLEQELGVSAALARSRLAEGVRQRLATARDALVERANEIDRIRLETTTARREVLTGDAVLSEESTREREIIADLGYEVWPFDGEYWEDEVTSYREVIRDRCGR